MRTVNTAPPAGRLAASIRPSCRSTIHWRDGQAEAGPVAGRPWRPVEPIEQARQVLGSDARTVVLDDEGRLAVDRAHPHRDVATLRDMANGVVDEDDDELAQPCRVADDLGRLRVDRDADGPTRGDRRQRRGPGRRDVAQVDRHPLEGDRAGVGPGQQQEVVDHRRQVVDLVADVDQGGADGRDRFVAMAFEVVDARADDGQRRAQLVRGVGGELALALQGRALGDERLADRDERPAGVGGAGAGRHEQGDHAADDEHGDEHGQRPHLGRPIADDLEVELRPAELEALGQHAHGRVGLDDGIADVPRGPVLDRLDPLQQWQARDHARLTGPLEVDLLTRPVGEQQERARPGPAEDEPPGREVVAGIRRLAGQLVRPCLDLGRAGRREGPRHRDVQHDAEDDEDGQRDAAAPQRQVEADLPQQAGLGRGQGRFVGIRGGRVGADAVRHRRVDSRHRERSRSGGRPDRACRAGSGRTRRPHWA